VVLFHNILGAAKGEPRFGLGCPLLLVLLVDPLRRLLVLDRLLFRSVTDESELVVPLDRDLGLRITLLLLPGTVFLLPVLTVRVFPLPLEAGVILVID